MDFATFVPRRILVCQLRQIGDVILMTPLPELLKKRFPQAAVHVLTEKKCVPVLENNPFIDRVWPIDKRELASLWKEVAYYRSVAAEGFDLVVDLQQTPRCRWVVYFSRAPVRLTRTPPWYTRWLYTDWTEPARGYASAMKAAVLSPLGIAWNGERPRIVLTEEEKRAAASYLASLGLTPEHTLVTVDATHRRETRRWPAQYYARLLEMAAAKRADLRFQLLFGPGEEDVVAEIAAHSENAAHLLPPGRLLSLREMAACIAASRMLVGNCSAPRHMAVAVGTPTLTIQGATSAGWVFPSPEHGYIASEIDCRPCNRNACDIGVACLRGLFPEAVLPEFMARLERACATASRHRAVSLEEILANREARVVRQREMLARGNGAVISFTVNMPGPVKDTPEAGIIFRAGLDALAGAVKDAGLAVAEHREWHLPTGPEALLGFAAQALAVKRMALAVEDTHPLGRLFDMDVLDASGAAISRGDLGAPMRACLVCGNKAALCARSGAHPLEELLAAVRKLVASSTS